MGIHLPARLSSPALFSNPYLPSAPLPTVSKSFLTLEQLSLLELNFD